MIKIHDVEIPDPIDPMSDRAQARRIDTLYYYDCFKDDWIVPYSKQKYISFGRFFRDLEKLLPAWPYVKTWTKGYYTWPENSESFWEDDAYLKNFCEENDIGITNEGWKYLARSLDKSYGKFLIYDLFTVEEIAIDPVAAEIGFNPHNYDEWWEIIGKKLDDYGYIF